MLMEILGQLMMYPVSVSNVTNVSRSTEHLDMIDLLSSDPQFGFLVFWPLSVLFSKCLLA